MLDGHLPEPGTVDNGVRGLTALSDFNQATVALVEVGYSQESAPTSFDVEPPGMD